MSERLDADRGSLLNRITPEMYERMNPRQRQKLQDMGYSSMLNMFGIDQNLRSKKDENLEQFYRQDDRIRNEHDYGTHWTGQPVTRGYHEAGAGMKALDWLAGPLWDL
jgi:hypothetical protein